MEQFPFSDSVAMINSGKKQLIAALGDGGASRLADALGITRSAVSQWQRIPAERVREVERLTGVPRHLLRPDLYEEDY